LREAIIILKLWYNSDKTEKAQEKLAEIFDEIKPKIYDVSHELQSLLIEHQQAMNNEK
jgi:hypothetical protein